MLTGIYPRWEVLVAATRDYHRGRIPHEELERHFERDYAQLIALQRDVGFGSYSDGLLNWQDLFRPFAEIIEHWESGPLVRYFDNNTFYRQPRITGALKIDASKLNDWLRRYFRTELKHLVEGARMAEAALRL
jgi:5-methyltetrahydropteroyltriglutamate--homocysteine methyltransferase